MCVHAHMCVCLCEEHEKSAYANTVLGEYMALLRDFYCLVIFCLLLLFVLVLMDSIYLILLLKLMDFIKIRVV